MRITIRGFIVACACCCLVFLVASAPASAQIPDEFTNLQVFPKDTPKRELMSAMRSFAGALGVRCTHCHPGKTPGSLEGVDFATDDLEPKRVARAMMKLTDEINSKLLPTTGRKNLMRVRCSTCHRGLEHPEPLDDVLMTAIEKDGVQAAVERYTELREDYYGSGSYDFGPGTLNSLAETLASERNDLDGAVSLLELNVANNPDASYSHLMLGQLYSMKGDKEKAIQSVERGLELDPENQRAKQMLEQLRSSE